MNKTAARIHTRDGKPLPSLIFMDDGNWGISEAHADNWRYRRGMVEWAKSYMAICTSLNKTGKVWENKNELQYPSIDLGICNHGVKPKPDQEEIILACMNLNRMAVFLGVGGGKTFIAGYAGWHAMKKGVLAGTGLKMLVACPKTAISEWVDQIPKFFPAKVRVFPDEPIHDADFVITNFAQLEKLVPMRHMFGGLINDESQNMKNSDTKRFRDMMALVDAHIQVRYVLSGTPMKNKPDDLFSQLTFINPYAFNFSKNFMLSRYFTQTGSGARQKKGFKKAGLLPFQTIVERNCYMKAAPNEGRVPSDIRLGAFDTCEKQNEMLKTVAQGCITIMDNAESMGPNASPAMVTAALKNELTKEAQVSSGFLKAGKTTLYFDSPKLAYAYRLATETWGDEQVIIWCYYKETVDRFMRALKNECAVIRGGMSNKDRDAARDDFKSGRKRVLIAQLDAANAALNFQNCRNAIFAELYWSPTTLDQAVGRIDRSGQLHQCRIIFLYTKGTVDELHLLAYNTKMDISGAIMRKFATSRNITLTREFIKKSTRKTSSYRERYSAKKEINVW